MVAQVLNFGVVFVVLYLFAFKPLVKIMKERTEKIQRGVLDAKTNAELLASAKTEYEKALTKARLEADRIFEEGKKEAEKKREQMLGETKEEVAAMILSGKNNLLNEKEKMLKDVRAEITSISVKIAEKILGSKIDGSFGEKTIKELENI